MADWLLQNFNWWFWPLTHLEAFLLGIWAHQWWLSRQSNGGNGNGHRGEAEERPSSIRAAM